MAAVTVPVRAAGGVVWRPTGAGEVEVCVVHRPRYDDWTLPKGKLEPGEHPLLAAVREIAEEADVRGVPQVRLPGIRYAMRDGTPKSVDYWSVRAVDRGGFQHETEVDALRWLPVGAAAGLLTYAHDAAVVRAFAVLPRVTAVLAVVRHARAGKRATWTGPDVARELDAAGRAQAAGLAELLAVVRPERLLSAAPRRCVQTLAPLAGRLDLPIEVDSGFDEPLPGQDGDENALAAAGRLVELATAGRRAVVCTQGKVLPAALAGLTGGDARDHHTPKGTGWLLAFAGERLVGADRLDPATV
ncbi:NUDIX hydrolase [Polymorphospora rubra]|uniref:NUDIX hydrolase n=1 Tax=Polymorphospora rubra TaxID=338584 RepID=UPI0033E72DE5